MPESQALLLDYVGRFDRLIRASGARTAVFMVWPSSQRAGDFPAVSRSYAHAASAVGGLLLPAGDAWQAAWQADGRLGLDGPDGFHPSTLGSLLAASVIFERLTGHRVPGAALGRLTAAERAAVVAATSAVSGDGRISIACPPRRRSQSAA